MYIAFLADDLGSVNLLGLVNFFMDAQKSGFILSGCVRAVCHTVEGGE